MKTYCTTFIRHAAAVAFILQCGLAFGQVPNPSGAADLNRLENSIKQKQTLVQARRELDSIYKQAAKTGDDILQARSLNYLIVVRDQLTEDSLYFRNSGIIDTLLASTKTSKKLKAILYVMQARRISRFNQQWHKFNIATYRNKNIITDYGALSNDQRTKLSGQYLDSALKVNAVFDKAAGTQLTWLSATPDVFLFAPQFEDIVLAEKVNQAAYANRNGDTQSEELINMLAMPSAAFINQLNNPTLFMLADGKAAVLNAYHDWMVFHKNDEATRTFIEALARKSLYLSMENDTAATQAYKQYLLNNINSRFDAVRALTVYQLCLLWKQDGNKYKDFDKYRYWSPNLPQPFDPRYQYLPAKALELYQQNIALMEKYPVLKQVLDAMAKQIKGQALRVEMNDTHLPGEPIALKATYKNTDTLYYRVVKINAKEPEGRGVIKVTDAFLKQPAVLSGIFKLPLPADNNVHAVNLMLDKLPVGRYRALFSYKPIDTLNHALSNVYIDVTNIIALNTDERVFVLDRKTGSPLAGAAVKAFKKKVPVQAGVAPLIPANGYIIVKDNIADSLSISYKGDTLAYDTKVVKTDNNRDVFDKDEYDDLTEFYDDKIRTEIFTDRAIYRPGQTVHYKVLFLTNHPQTGEVILFNKQNLGSGIFKAWLQKWKDDKKDLVELRDVFNKKIDSAHVVINEFGSFSGSFTLPKTAATGRWSIDGSVRNDYQNEGSFRVEEYKRPTIELNVEAQKKVLLPGEPFTIKLKLRSFNGGDLNNIAIKYTLRRTGSVPVANAKRGLSRYSNIKLLDTTGNTNALGELIIAVNDTALSNARLSDSLLWRYDYQLEANAVDLTGESAGAGASISAYSRPVDINVNLSGQMDRNALPELIVRASDRFAGDLHRNVNIKIFKANDPQQEVVLKKEVDQWYYTQADWNKWFPQAQRAEAQVKRELLLDTIVNTGDTKKINLDSKKFPAGFYELEATARDGDRTMGKILRGFTVFDSKTGEWVGKDVDFMPVNSVKAGMPVTWFGSGRSNNFTIYRASYVNKNRQTITHYETFTEKAGIRQWHYTVPKDANGTVLITRIAVLNNVISQSEKRVFIYQPEKENPQIIVERYRSILAPGAEEKFTVSIKTKNDNTAAELMTTLYDASLDKLEQHRWQLPQSNTFTPFLFTNWDKTTGVERTAEFLSADLDPVNLFNLSALERENGISYELEGKVAGLNIASAAGLNEVVIVGYGTTRSNLTGSISSVTINGSLSIEDILKKLPGIEVDAAGNVITLGRTVTQVRINGKDYVGGDLRSAANGLPADILERMQVIDDYGDQASIAGVKSLETRKILNFTLSADGRKINVILEPLPAVIKIRKNFNETAFFFPQVHADKDGFYSFSFTMPETATEWNWKMLAQTRDARFAYLEKKLQTQLNLMVQPNMPRLLYQGDKIKLQSRVSNLDTLGVKGKATLKIEDAVTGEDITRLLSANAETQFNLDKKSTGSVEFMLNVPVGQSNPLKIVIAATAGSVADAEEHIIPVLSSSVFIRQSVPVRFDNKATITISKPKLPADAVSYGVGISINQQPQAALIYALPWLANYSFDCAEQTFNKLRAQVMALKLMQKDTSVQNAFKRVKASSEKEQIKTDALPDEMAEAAMPWLTLTNNTANQQKQLFRMLDTSANKTTIEKHLRRLYALQKPDGGLSWFDGPESNSYISAYVLAGFGQLQQMGWTPGNQLSYLQKAFIDKLINFSQNKLLTDSTLNVDKPNLLYALSYWQKDHPLSTEQSVTATKLLDKEWSKIADKNLQQQALLIINTYSYLPVGNPLRKQADAQLENIRQMAIQDDLNGIRWKAIADAESMNTTAEETMALLAEAFELSSKYKDVQAGIVKWLLSAKQQQHWQTTKATAAAIDMLQKDKGSAFGGSKAFSAEIAGKQLTVSDGLLDGKPTDFSLQKETPASITLKQTGTNTTGAATWYYFAKPEALDTLNKAVKIKKEFFVYDGKTVKTNPVTPGTILKPGDRLQVKLTVDAAVSLQYVHISDTRAALFEPGDNLSGYRYTKGTGYYQSVRDTGLELFTEAIPRGVTEFTYDVVVAHSGQFSGGSATLQCMYQPSLTAYSNTHRFTAE